MKCPNCELINPDTALCCDCGYDFQSGKMREPYSVDVSAIPVWALVFQAFMVLVSIVFIAPSGYLIYGLISFLLWFFAVGFVFEMMTVGKNLARIVLAIMAFPVGLIFLHSPWLNSYIRRRSINI